MFKLNGTVTSKAIKILVANILTKIQLLKTDKKRKLSYCTKKEKLKLINCQHVSVYPHPHKLFTEIIKNRLSNKVDENKAHKQTGFRKKYSTIDHIQTEQSLIKKCYDCYKYNTKLYLVFVIYNNRQF